MSESRQLLATMARFKVYQALLDSECAYEFNELAKKAIEFDDLMNRLKILQEPMELLLAAMKGNK